MIKRFLLWLRTHECRKCRIQTVVGEYDPIGDMWLCEACDKALWDKIGKQISARLDAEKQHEHNKLVRAMKQALKESAL